MANYYHDNAQHIDHSRTIYIDGSVPNLDSLLRDFLRDEPAPQSASQAAEEPSPSSPQQQEEKQDCQWDVVDKAFNFSHTIQELVVEMAKTCTKPWHYACMIAVLDDYNLVKDRYAYTAIADALKEWSIIVNPNSLGYKLSDLPSDFHSLDQKAWKKEYNKCVALENSISTRNGYTYRHKKS